MDCGFEEARTSFGEQLARRAIAEPIELMFGMSIAGDHRIAPLPSSAHGQLSDTCAKVFLSSTILFSIL